MILFLLSSPVLSQSNFDEISTQYGVNHIHKSPWLMGGGVLVFDMNNDGFDDLYLTGGTEPDKLYQNINGEYFKDISLSSYIRYFTRENTHSATSADFDNDGYQDIFITTSARDPNILLHNNKDMTFSNITVEAGITESVWSTGATIADFNNDKYLDIYVINYINIPVPLFDDQDVVVGFSHSCYPNLLYINNGNLTFSEKAEEYGLNEPGCGLAVTTLDFENDGDIDIYVSNDFGEWIEPNKLFLNQYPENGFEEKGNQHNLDVNIYGMGIGLTQFNEDDIFDIYLSNIGANYFMVSNSESEYSNKARELKIEDEFQGDLLTTSWGTSFFDLDNDMDEDLIVANGYIPTADFIKTSTLDSNRIFINNGMGTFSDYSYVFSQDPNDISRGLAIIDHDNNGFLDFAIANVETKGPQNSRSKIYSNQTNNENSYIKFIVEGVLSNRDAIGSTIHIFIGGEKYSRYIAAGSSYGSQNSKTVHFGTELNEEIDSLELIWSRSESKIYNEPLKTNRTYYIKEFADKPVLSGCLDESSFNFSKDALFNSGCIKDIYGCLDLAAINFDNDAEIDNGTCEYITSVTQNNNSLKIYPNPASNFLFVSNNGNPKLKFTILDMSYRIIETGELSENKIAINHLHNGIYLLRITDTDLLEVHRFIKDQL
ncbi:MAG: VCBS repeat-containing protein [Reichenbachiella sp.]